MKLPKLRLLVAGITLGITLQAAEPLRIFIRSSPKTHGGANGNHDYPAFLDSWSKLLPAYGAVAVGAPRFPTADELSRTDVLIDYSSDGANFSAPEKELLEAYLRRGGGLVVIHDGMCGPEPDWFSRLAGGAKMHGGPKNSRSGMMRLHFEDPANPILRGAVDKGAVDFDFDDEMFFLLTTQPGIKVLATTADPTGKIVPQLWTWENKLPGGTDYRAFVTLQGHKITNFDNPVFQGLLLRGIAWAGGRSTESLLPVTAP